MNKRVLITGINGQSGSYLAEHLLSKGYIVDGIVRSSMTNSYNNIEGIKDNINIIQGDLADIEFIRSLPLEKYDRVYHLAAQSHVGMSFTIPRQTWQINFHATFYLLDAYFSKRDNIFDSRFYFAGTSEMFGSSPAPQNENTPFNPVSPYAQAKYQAFTTCEDYRKAGKFVCSSIFFNHESPRRGKQFVTQKIIQAIKNYKENKENNILILGNLDAIRDWGYAKEYVEAMELILENDYPDTFIIATNTEYTVKDFIIESLKSADISNYSIIENIKNYNLDYNDLNNIEEIKANKDCFYVLQSQDFYRPNEVNHLKGDYSKAEKVLGWKPKTLMPDLVKIMLA